MDSLVLLLLITLKTQRKLVSDGIAVYVVLPESAFNNRSGSRTHHLDFVRLGPIFELNRIQSGGLSSIAFD